jgi:hypothetical protein
MTKLHRARHHLALRFARTARAIAVSVVRRNRECDIDELTAMAEAYAVEAVALWVPERGSMDKYVMRRVHQLLIRSVAKERTGIRRGLERACRRPKVTMVRVATTGDGDDDTDDCKSRTELLRDDDSATAIELSVYVKQKIATLDEGDRDVLTRMLEGEPIEETAAWYRTDAENVARMRAAAIALLEETPC